MTADRAISPRSGERKAEGPERLFASEVDMRSQLLLDRGDVSSFRKISNRRRRNPDFGWRRCGATRRAVASAEKAASHPPTVIARTSPERYRPAIRDTRGP